MEGVRKEVVRDMNDTERENWVQNDESLYLWWKGTRVSMRDFLRRNRADIDAHIKEMTQRPSETPIWA